MTHYLEAISSFFAHPLVACFGLSVTTLVKIFVAGTLIKYFISESERRIPLALLFLFVVGTLFNDLSYFLMGILRSLVEKGEVRFFTFLCRTSWILFITCQQALALFFQYLLTKKIRITPFHILHLLFNIGITSCFIYLAVGCYYVPSSSPETLGFELRLIYAAYLYTGFLYGLILFSIIKTLSKKNLPRILEMQIRHLCWFLIPFQITQALDAWRTFFKYIPVPGLNKYSCATLSALLSAYVIYAIGKKIMGLRFLNIRKEVISSEHFNFLAQFKDILERLGTITALNELDHITQTFFQTAFGITFGRTHLRIRSSQNRSLSKIDQQVEQSVSTDTELAELLYRAKICIRDEVHFSSFYDNDTATTKILSLLDSIHADLFLPIYEKSHMIAYIRVERDARPNKLYTNKERDEMLVFTAYLSNVISTVRHSSIEALQHQRKQLTEELYHKHQEINQYQELIRTHMRTSHERKIGIIFYKHRRFTYANEAAHELLGYDLNRQAGHPLTKTCTSVARRVREYKTTQTSYAQDAHGKRLVILGIPSTEGTSSILLIYYPELSDVIKLHLDQLKDPSQWDYVLYLETTESGRLINQLIPSTSDTLLTFKVNLLSACLSKKAIFLSLAEEDLMATVELIHSLSLRKTLHTITLTTPEKNNAIALKLFGLNQLMGSGSSESLLEKLGETGSLLIQNIELLSIQTQKALAQFLKLGYFTRLKSDYKVASSARIICSSAKDLQHLTQSGAFSQELFEQLHQTSLMLPPLASLDDSELTSLVNGYAEQLIPLDTFKHVLALSEKDTQVFLTDRPLSLHELKERVHQILVEKSHRHQISEATEFNPAYNVTDPTLAQAVRLGKKALKDPKIMSLLWHKFKNQSKIAQLLGVNRSSVNRRCQEYNLR